MLTLFTTAKAFAGHNEIIQRNALKSWTLLHPDIEIILFGKDEGAAELSRELGARSLHRSKKKQQPDYLESAYDSPFMILTAQVRPEKRSVIPSVTHVDGSARPQTVEREINPLYYRLIDEFGKITGVPVIMNTSFNLRGEAIVHTPTDAVRTFFSSGMDALVIGSFLVEK